MVEKAVGEECSEGEDQITTVVAGENIDEPVSACVIKAFMSSNMTVTMMRWEG